MLAYKIFDQDPAQAEPGAQVTNLKLTPQLVAQIFTGSIPNWEVNAQITDLNPRHIFPPTILPLVRGDHSDAKLRVHVVADRHRRQGAADGLAGPVVQLPAQAT